MVLAVAMPWVLVTAVHGGAVPAGSAPLIRFRGLAGGAHRRCTVVTIVVGGDRLASRGHEIVAAARSCAWP